jgi:acyl-CoA dehydrogenase
MAPALQDPRLWWALFAALALVLAHAGAARRTWMVLLGLVVAGLVRYGDGPRWSEYLAVALWAVPALLFGFAPLRRLLVAAPLLAFYRRSMPELSTTEREALDAGGVWWDAELFSGRPRWQRLLELPPATLSAEEQAFLDGPTEQLCAMLDDHRITQELDDLPPEAWRFIKSQGFFGMVIPREHGGKGFSQHGHAAVVMKVATRSISAALTVMIPNSVGPAKLLLKYGTEAQKQRWIPRLASGAEVPCFALTGPEAGSDAGAMRDVGVVCRQDGVLGIRLDFDKRYITLGPVATVLGVAFKLRDPEHLLGERADLGITLALVPAGTAGLEQGRRHDPLHMAFMNGPVRGRGVFVPIDAVIGGVERVGQGWRMLMESLTDGRAISLPALSTAAAKVCVRAAGAYARVRVQFRTPIARFEGVEEALARLGGNAYAMDAARLVTLAALDSGHKPSVVSAIVKYNLTARAGTCVTDAMAIHGGAAICLGPRNPIGQLLGFPGIGMTVEGHNILTRSMITFGQGAIRGHSFLREELEAAGERDAARALARFDAALAQHLGLAVRNAVRAFAGALTGARLEAAPAGVHPATVRHYRATSRLSAAFAFATDVLLLTYRGELKRRERVGARMADVVSQLYLASCALKRFHDAGSPNDDLALLDWAVEDALHRAEQALVELLPNLPWAPRALLRLVVLPLGPRHRPPSDQLEHRVARSIAEPGPARDRLAAGMYLPTDPDERFAVLEEAMRCAIAAEPLERKQRAGGQLSAEEAAVLAAADAARRAAIAVDER